MGWVIVVALTLLVGGCGGSEDKTQSPNVDDADVVAAPPETSAPPIDIAASASDTAASDRDETRTPTSLADTSPAPPPDSTSTHADGWDTPCTEDDHCWGVTDYCAKLPGQTEGYCTTKCTGPGDCPALNWGCNAVFECKIIDYTWCGPASEIENGQGFVRACE